MKEKPSDSPNNSISNTHGFNVYYDSYPESPKETHASPPPGKEILAYIPDWVKIIISFFVLIASFIGGASDFIGILIPIEDPLAVQILRLTLTLVGCIWLGEISWGVLFKSKKQSPRILKVVAPSLFLALSVSSCVLFFQAYQLYQPFPPKISGQLINVVTGEPIRGAQVFMIGPKETIINQKGPWYTGYNGRYSILNEGNFRIAQLLISIPNNGDTSTQTAKVYLIKLEREIDKEQIVSFEDGSMIISHTRL